MNLFDDLNDDNYMMFAMKYYENIQCTSVDEFNDDLNKIKYVKRLFNRFLETGELKTNLILNHLIVIYNVFENQAATRLLFYSIEKKFYSILKPFLIFLDRPRENYWNQRRRYSNKSYSSERINNQRT